MQGVAAPPLPTGLTGITPTSDPELDDDRPFDAVGDVISQALQRIVEEKVSPPIRRCCVEFFKPIEKILVLEPYFEQVNNKW
jgi:hypothetical protein